jgi:hypothetical protein
MVQECVDRYEAVEQEDGSLLVTIRVPRRFANLWLSKLSGLRTTPAEISEYELGPGSERT